MLEQYAEPVAYEAAFWLQGVEDPNYPLAQLGKLSLEVSDRFRALAIIALTTAGSVDGFQHNLIRSGRVRTTYLSRIHREEAWDDHHYASGRHAPLIDAVASSDLKLAREIARLSPAEWRKGHEYLDDYCFAQLVQGFVVGSDPARSSELLLRYQGYLDGNFDARLDLLRALLEGDAAAFESAFEARLNEHERSVLAGMQRGELETPSVLAQRKIFVEGIAFLRLAELCGIHVAREYKFCPSLALEPSRTPFPGE